MDYTKEEIELRKEFEKLKNYYGEDVLLKEYDDVVLSLNNAALSTIFAKIDGPNREKHSEIVLNSNNLHAIYELSIDYPTHLKYIIDSHDVHYNLEIIKLLYDDGIYEINKVRHKNDKSEKINKKISMHVESISKSDNITDLKEFIVWFYPAFSYEKGYNDFSFLHPYSWVESVGVDLLSESLKYLNDIVKTLSKEKNPNHLYKTYQLMKNIKEFANTYNIKCDIDFDILHDALVNTNSPKYNYELINKYEIDKKNFKKHERAIIDSCNPEYNYLIANRFKDCDIKVHEKIVLESGNAKLNYLFAKNVENADILKHMEVIIKSKNPEYCFMFALNFDNADKKRLGEVVIESNDPEYNYLFCKKIEDSNIEEHKKVVSKSRELEYNYECCFIGDDGSTLNKLNIINSGNVRYIYRLALEFPDDDLFDEYVNAIIKSKNEEYIAKIKELKPYIINSINNKIKILKKN